MNNDPELDGKYLGEITKDFAIIADTLKEASYQVKSKGFSDFPIFPISKEVISIGQLLIKKEELAISWNVNITYVDEFVQRELIKDANAFKNAYKNPDEFCCLFVTDGTFTNFVFLPYPID